MRNAMKVREAEVNDAMAACNVLIRSITELCIMDHQGDRDKLEVWLENKTPEQVSIWIASAKMHVLVGEVGGKVVAVGAATSGGEVLLNYVLPEHRFQGLSSAILARLEAWIAEQGVHTSTLTSTETGARFYRDLGYQSDGAPEVWAGMQGYPMKKELAQRTLKCICV